MAQRGCDSFFRDMEDAQNKLLQQMKSSTSKERNDALLERFHKEYSQQLISFDEERMRRCGYLDSQYGNATASFKKLLKQCNLKLREEEGTLYLSFDENALFKKFSKDISEELTKILQDLEDFYTENVDKLVDMIVAEAKPTDHILVMSNGSFVGIHQKILDRLK